MLLSIFFLMLSLLAQPTIGSEAHEIHISKCQIEYSQEDKAVQVILHIYLDDLEEIILKNQGKDKLYICTEKENEEAEKQMAIYLEEAFQLNINNEKAEFDFIGKEPSEDLLAVWAYLEFPNVEQLEALTVTNTILMDLYDDQKNIVSVSVPGKKQGYFLFQPGSSTESLDFK